MMRTRYLLLRLLLIPGLLLHPVRSGLQALEAGDWTLETILERVEEANGGAKALPETSRLRVLGEVTIGPVSYEFLLLKKRPDKVRIHFLHKG